MTCRALRPVWLLCLFWLAVRADATAAPAVVVIDPGHGGQDRGGIPGQWIAEKSVTLDTAKRLERVLRSTGNIRVVMTRSGDYFVSLTERTNTANAYRGRMAVFVSIHYNAGPRESAYGIETYYYDWRAYRLAAAIHPRVIRAMNTVDRGIRRRGYWVLRRNLLPAVLVECGFLTNRVEGRKALDARYRQRIAEAIAEGIIRY
jgi:N-acetylmuramoyl-L-alanine amidase